MQLKQIGSNMTELSLPDNLSVLFSYETPVAGWDQDGPFKTEQFYSKTTSKHINKYFGGQTDPRLVSQDYINQLTEG
jgi:hypothetical protein|tara:strand:- start:181 stop:411 length:231 start_codon:yes stop_codon:yes gene_type:complete